MKVNAKRGDPPRQKPSAELRLGEAVLIAAGLEGAEREDYLRRIAASDRDLAAAARRRIAAAEEIRDSFLSTPAATRLEGAPANPEPVPASATLPPGERYELGERLGEGGMGRVLAAYDRQLDRSVALKFLNHEDPQVTRLFLREARAQARVRHDHVLEIYDSGEIDNQPFIAMRYVAGGTLAEAASGLSLEHKARLLAQVAEGLHAAHLEGLLHRDVKPSNVLVDQTPDGQLRALVSDFGLAAELEDAESMAAGAVAGSPHYIAPERLSGAPANIDRRSDIYSLGVVMYRLFTGELPFRGENTMDFLRQALLQDFPPPRQRMPALPVELEAITLRCLARDPAQRYASAKAVAADLQRYLNGEVAEAYAAGLAYRLTRFVLRNKLLAGLTAAAALVLLASSVAVAVFALRADSARQRAELRQGQAEELIRFMVVDLRDKLESVGRLDILDAAGGAATEYFAAVPEEELSEAELLRRSRMLYQIGDVRIRQGDLAAAAVPMEQSLALTRRLAALRPDDGERLFELGQSHFWVGRVYWEQGDLAATRGPWESYLDVSRRLVAKEPGNRVWRRELSYGHSNLGSLLQAENDLEGALEQFLATLAIDQELVAADPADAVAREDLAATHNAVGVVLQDLGRLGEAGQHLAAELDIRRALFAAESANPRARNFLATSHSHLGILLFMLGEWMAAGEHFQAAQEILVELVTHDPANTPWKFKLAWSYLHLGRVAYAQGDWAAADAAWSLERRLIGELLTSDTPHHAWRRTQAIGLYHLALLRVADGASARTDLLAAVRILEDLAASRPSDRAVHRWLGQSYLLLGKLANSPAAARAAFERAKEKIAPFAGAGRDARLLAPWAVALSCLGRPDEASPIFEALDTLGYALEPGISHLCQFAK